MNRKIKSDLFRFVTLRTPQLLTEEQKAKNFVFHPDLNQSAIYKGLQPKPAIPGGLEPEIPVDGPGGPAGPVSITPIATKAEIKALSPVLYVFSQWLAKNRGGKFAVSEVMDRSREIDVLSEGNLLLVWENVFYQTIHKKNAAIREALIQLLVANHFLTLLAETAFSESVYEDFTITANAKLVIPKLIAARRQKSPSAQSRYVDTSKVQSDFDTAQKLAQMELYQNTITELQDVNRQYNAQTALAYKAALDAHEVVVADELSRATKVIDPETGRVTYPDAVIPKFIFTPLNPLAQPYLEDRISDAAHGVFDTLALGRCNNLAEAIAVVESEMQKLGSSFSSTAAPVQKVVVYRGNAIETNITENRTADPVDILYGYKLVSVMEQVAGTPQSWDFAIELNAGYNNPVISSVSYTAAYNNTVSAVNTQFTQVSNNGFVVKAGLYTNGLAVVPNALAVRLQGTITLDNGNVLAFDATVSANSFTPGIATLVAAGGGEGESGGLIGIHQMGIADYRKVEQEVCCYVPGEVSHIENVMKGEYKERATRRLRRSENTIETSVERETENLSDTTSTERNEMHNEVSRVINKDQSINANASLNANFKNISFSASGGYASSTSQSDSASQAVNYAKDVTARAMERVVQKITEKRTTKMIDEFEETTKHGLDNRGEGAQNVSGVYHWIDKVYTNQVVNYGKRLMYEMMVPEPARFLTKAATAAGSTLQVLNKPVDPSTLLKDAKQITPANYQHFAAMYNAEVKPAPVSGMSIGKSFSSAFTTKGSSAGGAMAKSEAVNVKIPEGYFTKAAKVQMSGMADGDYNWGKGISVGVGNSVLNQRDMAHPFAHNNFNAPLILDKFTDEIPVSVFFCSFFTGQVTIAIELEVLPEFVAKWQNETYGAIIAAYEAKKEAYEKALADALDKTAAAATPANSTKYNPLQSRMVEMAELKKNCLQLMLEPYGNPVGVKTIRPDGFVNINGTFATHADKVRFFEAAFEWEIMSYIFYPYFWADEAEWKNLFSQEDGDHLFKAFLQSGMGKVILSVRPGFEEAVMYYLETGEIWDGKNLAMDDELYLSILAEQLPAEGKPEGEPWETRLPTSLTTLQGDSIALTSTGLPCACDDGTGNGFSSSNAGLIGKP